MDSHLNDEPIADAEDDALGRGPFVEQTVRLIRNVAERSESTVFGLQAPWGAGKTSLLNLIRKRLDGDGWGVVEFNPWEVGDLHALTREFLTALTTALPNDEKGSRAREALRRYGRRAASFSSVVKVPGVDLSKLVEAVLSATEPDESLPALRRGLVDALEKLAQPILVLIDDVDRLQSDELLTLLKLVRLLGRLPNVFYVLAFDETTIRNVLRRSDIGHDGNRAQDYLEKIVQVRVDVPPLHRTHHLAMTNELVDGIVARHDLELAEGDWDRYSRVYHDVLAQILTGPRQIKRYYAQVETYLPLVAGEVDFVDFSVVTALRTFFPDLYVDLPKHRRGLTRSELRADKLAPDEELQRWRDLVAQHVTDEPSRETALSLLATIFEPVHRAGNKWTTSTVGGLDSITRRRGVGSAEYFDRYFVLGVPSDDIPDTEVRGALAEVIAGGSGLADRMLDIIRSSTNQTAVAEPLIDKLRRFSPTDPEASRALLPFAAEIAKHAPPTGFIGRTQMTAHWWFTDLLASATLADPPSLLDSLEAAASTQLIGWSFLAGEREGQEPPPNAGEREPFRQEFLRRVRGRLDDLSARPLGDGVQAWGLYKVMADFTSDDEAKAWLQRAVSDGPWTVEGVATFFVERRSLVGRDDFHPGGFDSDLADRLLGLDFALKRVTPTPDGGRIDWNGNAPDTYEERVRRVHAALQRIASERGAITGIGKSPA